jgi:uncharacterized repeat protein (TIGR01451 family)
MCAGGAWRRVQGMNKRIRPILFTVCSTATVLAACTTSAMAATASETKTVPGTYTFVVPAGVQHLSVELTGASGGMDAGANGCVPRLGGELKGTVSVTPGAHLVLTVGSAGGDASGTYGGAAGQPAGGPGGDVGNAGGFGGGGGGGYSQLSEGSGVIARVGGGGGCGGSADGTYGDGGNADGHGQNGSSASGGASGDTGGAPGEDAPSSLGTGLTGGVGRFGGDGSYAPQLGGGGGGGGWGGGGGGGGTDVGYGIAGGGGGGSAFVNNQLVSVEASGTSTAAGDGSIEISWTMPGTPVGALFSPWWGVVSNETILQTGSPAPWSYTVPADGVITSWAYESGPDAPTAVEFKVGRGAAGHGGGYAIVGETGTSSSPGSNQVDTVPARIPVRAGDVLGASIYGSSDVGLVPFGTGAVATSGDQQPDFGAATYTPFPITVGWDIESGTGGAPGTVDGAVLPIEAFVEPDADHDGFGDISQDQCPGLPGSAHGCPLYDLGVSVATPSGSYRVGDTLHYLITVSNGGPDPSPPATLTDDPGAGATVVSADPSNGSCSTGARISCALEPLAAGAAATVAVTLRATSAGSISNVAAIAAPAVPAAAGAGDRNPGNDAQTSAINILPAPSGETASPTAPGGSPTSGSNPGASASPHGGLTPAVSFAGVALRLRGPILVAGTRARLSLASDLSAAGTLTLTSRARVVHGRRIRLAQAAYSVHGGQVTAMTVRLDRRALRLLRAHRRLPVLVVLRSHDAAGASATVTQSAVLAPATKRLSAAAA